MKRTLTVIAHVERPSIGVLERSARNGGWMIDIVRPFQGEMLPPPDQLQALVVLGGPQSAYDPTETYLAREVDYLKIAHRLEIPTLGLCLGSQLLADALGGASHEGEAGLECGLIDVVASTPDLPLGGRFFSFHSDTAAPPSDAELLATSASYVQSWRVGRSLAVQFHPEVEADDIDAILATEEAKLAQYGIDVATLRTSVAEEIDAATSGERLLDAWFAIMAACSVPHNPDHPC